MIAIACPKCQSAMDVPAPYLGKEVKCGKCGSAFVAAVAAPVPAPVPVPAPSIRTPDCPPCQVCGSPDMSLRRLYRCSSAGALIGYLILIPSAIYTVVAIMASFTSISDAGDESSGMAIIAAALFLVPGIVGVGIGSALIKKKTVGKCSSCGAERGA